MSGIAKGIIAVAKVLGKAATKTGGQVATKTATQVATKTATKVATKTATQVATKTTTQVATKTVTQVATKTGNHVARTAGPSGKPALHFIDKSTKKQAYEAAKHAGKGEPIHHANPTVGKPHYHPNNNPKDYKGLDKNIKKDGTHYTYPK